MADFFLYLDESGSFHEGMSPGRPGQADGERPLLSQLAGILVPMTGKTTTLDEVEATAAKILLDAHKKVGKSLRKEVHATELKINGWTDRDRDQLMSALLAELRQRNWQPVRAVNVEQVGYGIHAENHSRMVAELVRRICERKKEENLKTVGIRLVCAQVLIAVRDREPVFIKHEQYADRVRDAFFWVQVRHGFRENWRLLDRPVILSARKERALQICDLLSYATSRDYTNCTDPDTRRELREAVGAYDFPVVLPELLARIDHLVADGSLGSAVLELVERLVREIPNDALWGKAEAKLAQILKRLADLGAPARDPQLNILVNWLEQIVDHQRNPDFGFLVADWMQTRIAEPIRQKLGTEQHTLDWFVWALHMWALTASNHRGTPPQAKKRAEALKALVPSLAGKWEHAPLIMQGLVATAVHLTDRFEHSAASRLMKDVARYYEGLAGLLVDAYPGVFPKKVRSDWRGRALGTWVQSETSALLRRRRAQGTRLGRAQTLRLKKARAVSRAAIREFTDAADKQRQYQYRCQLETAAQEFAFAQKFLASSLNLPVKSSHQAIAKALVGMAAKNPGWQLFPLLHWLRLGAACLNAGHSSATDFLNALPQTHVLDAPWGTESCVDYPAHGILRQVARIHAFCGAREILKNNKGAANNHFDGARRVLDHLRGILNPIGNGQGQLVLGAIQLAAYAEVSEVVAPHAEPLARQLLGTLANDLRTYQQQSAGGFPKIWEIFDGWLGQIKLLTAEWGSAPRILNDLATNAGQVGY